MWRLLEPVTGRKRAKKAESLSGPTNPSPATPARTNSSIPSNPDQYTRVDKEHFHPTDQPDQRNQTEKVEQLHQTEQHTDKEQSDADHGRRVAEEPPAMVKADNGRKKTKKAEPPSGPTIKSPATSVHTYSSIPSIPDQHTRVDKEQSRPTDQPGQRNQTEKIEHLHQTEQYTDKERSDSDHGRRVAEEPPVTVKADELETDDIVIAVMGPTGAGKSSFIRCATGHDTKGVGHSLKSCTDQVLAVRFFDQESGRNVVLVDTPGFDDTYKSDFDILKMISEWLRTSYSSKKLLSSILYFHRITDNRMAGTPLKNLRLFRKLCGGDALDTVYLTTTMWDEVDEGIGNRRLEELKTTYWKEMIEGGAQTFRCSTEDASPKLLIRQIVDQDAARKAVLLQEEMGEMKKELKETSAGQLLFTQLEALVEKQTQLLRRIAKEKTTASDPGLLEELRKEYDDLRAQIDDRLRQMQELKLPWFRNLRRLVPWGRERG